MDNVNKEYLVRSVCLFLGQECVHVCILKQYRTYKLQGHIAVNYIRVE
jgi:hypothetical protein